MTMENYFEGLGVTTRELAPGTVVMVAVGQGVAHINGDPCLIAWAVVRGPATEKDIEAVGVDPGDTYWLDVYAIPGGDPLPQMYRAGEILGVPALGLRMDGAPDPRIVVRD
jgi:hypothetical protein